MNPDEIIDQVTKLKRMNRRLRENLAAVVKCWHEEAHEGDGIAERHQPAYQAAKELLATLPAEQPREGGEG